MRRLPLSSLYRIGPAIWAVCLTAIPGPAPAQSAPAQPARPAAVAQAAAKPNANDEMLDRAGKRYYSTAKDGLTGFDCTVHPDWHVLFLSAEPGVAIAVDDPRIVLLNAVKIVLHARMKGNSTVEWAPPPAQDKSSTDLLEGMHSATEQTLQGFLQFWTPFVDGSAVPSSSEGLDIARTDKGYKLHAKTSDTEVTEELDNQLLLTQFDVAMSQARVTFSPTYKTTDKGLLVDGFLAHILPAGTPPAQVQEMHVAIEYQPVGGIPIPARLKMKVIGSGEFFFALGGCTIRRQ